MSIKTLIEEAMNKNAIGFETALKEELQTRINESLANWNAGIISAPRNEPFKLKKIVATSPRGKTYTFDNEAEAAHHHGKDTWEKMKAGAGGWKVDLDNKKPHLDEGVLKSYKKIEDVPDQDLKWHVSKNIPHMSFTRQEMKDEHKRRQRYEPGYNDVKDKLSEEQIDEVSGAKLGDYIVKSRADVTARKERGEKMRQEIIKQYPELKGISRPIDRKTWMRPKSQQLAVKKLTGQAIVNATEKKEE